MLKLIESLLRHLPPAALQGSHNLKQIASLLVDLLLEQAPLTQTAILEATVHRGRRSKIFTASFTGPLGGQVWKTTGLTDYYPALGLARHWEAEARAQRSRLDRTIGLPRTRVRPTQAGPAIGWSQKEVAQILHMSERGVRQAEQRAIRKLRLHPLLKDLWHKYLSGELDEHRWALDPVDIVALFDLAETAEELQLVEKLLRIIYNT
jgi:hypothetical protein